MDELEEMKKKSDRFINRLREWVLILVVSVGITLNLIVLDPNQTVVLISWDNEKLAVVIAVSVLGVVHTVLLRLADLFFFPWLRRRGRYEV